MANFEILVGTKVSDTIQKQLDASPKKTVTVTPILNTKGIQTGTKSISQYVDSAGKMVTVTDKMDTSGKTVSSTFTKVKSTVDTTSQTLQTASKHTKTLGEDFVSTAGKVAKFGAITAIFGLITRAIGEAVSSVKELDSVMTEFNKVSDLSGESLTEYTKMLGEMGTEVARTRSEMISASTEFVKSGYTEEQSAQLAKIASLYQNVADSEISAGESSSYLISQMKAFNITAEDAISIIDKTNEVANKFAVSSTDISTALTKSSSALAVYGNDINQTIAMVTAGSEVMTGQASKVSKG